jgi:REP element-mobilizing transposase RayT
MARLPKLERVFPHNPIYFLTICTAYRRPMLAQPIVHDAFIAFALRAPEYGAAVGRYVLMPDHMHLFVRFASDGIPLAKWVKSLKNAISKVLRNATFSAPHWERDYFDRVIRSREPYEQKWLYVRDNPVRAGLVKNAENWPYGGEIHELSFL